MHEQFKMSYIHKLKEFFPLQPCDKYFSVGLTQIKSKVSDNLTNYLESVFNTWNMLHSAVQFLHAINLSEDNTLASLQAMWSVVHAGYHPRIALKFGPN